MNFFKLVAYLTLLCPISSTLLACPFCQTAVGQQVRQGIFNHTFFINLFHTFLPFMVFILIAFFTYQGPPSMKALKNRFSLRGKSRDE